MSLFATDKFENVQVQEDNLLDVLLFREASIENSLDHKYKPRFVKLLFNIFLTFTQINFLLDQRNQLLMLQKSVSVKKDTILSLIIANIFAHLLDME